MKARIYAALETLGIFLAALGFLILAIQLAGLWRFGMLDEWAEAATLPGTFEQWCVLAYLAALIVCLSVRE